MQYMYLYIYRYIHTWLCPVAIPTCSIRPTHPPFPTRSGLLGGVLWPSSGAWGLMTWMMAGGTPWLRKPPNKSFGLLWISYLMGRFQTMKRGTPSLRNTWRKFVKKEMDHLGLPFQVFPTCIQCRQEGKIDERSPSGTKHLCLHAESPFAPRTLAHST